jgi:uncharacterized membrane protein YbhN (UPF0104 family)
MLKIVFVNALKILVAGSLIFWLVTSGKLDFRLLAELRRYPLSVLAGVILSILNLGLISFRWETILRARSQVTLPIAGLVKITWIGQFFSSVLPGSVSGDLVKILYVQKFDRTFSKRFVFASILIDRVMGLSGLILLVGISSLIFGERINANAPAMAPLLKVNYVLTGLVIAAYSVFFFFHGVIRAALRRLEAVAVPTLFQKVGDLWDDLVLIRSKMAAAVALSVVVQFIGVVVFWFLVHPFVGERMTFVQALAFIPVGFMTLALPIAPSGLGVGHAIFQKLFELSGIANGASLFNVYFVVTLAVNIFGVIPYLTTQARE